MSVVVVVVAQIFHQADTSCCYLYHQVIFFPKPSWTSCATTWLFVLTLVDTCDQAEHIDRGYHSMLRRVKSLLQQEFSRG